MKFARESLRSKATRICESKHCVIKNYVSVSETDIENSVATS